MSKGDKSFKRNGHNSKFMQIPESWESQDFNKSLLMKKESFTDWADKMPEFISKGKRFDRTCNVISILGFPEVSPSGKIETIKEFHYTHNLVTNDGEIYYARLGAAECPIACENFAACTARFEIGTAATTPCEAHDYSDFSAGCGNPICGSKKAYTACFPQTDCMCADNTGATTQTASYSVSYTTCDWNDASVEEGVIFGIACPGCCTSLLSHFAFCPAPFAKTACDTLKIFVNHTFENV